MIDDAEFERDNFPRGIGDPRGFYYPLSKASSLLRVNKQIRSEALPITYRRTTFHLYNIESAIKFLIAIGRIGRENIETLHLAWDCTLEPTNNGDTSSEKGPSRLRLPPRITSTCIQLLKQCKRLRHLYLQFYEALVWEVGLDTFMADVATQDLDTLPSPVKKLEVEECGMVTVEYSSVAEWLKKQTKEEREEEEQRNKDTDGSNVTT